MSYLTKMSSAIFDLDGTLLDTIDDIARICNKVFIEFGIFPRKLEQYRSWVGPGLRRLIHKAIGKENKDISKIHERILEEYAKDPICYTKVYPGVEHMLHDIVDANISIAVLSNKADELVKKIVHNFFSDIPFVTVRGVSHRFPPKPNPAQALDIAICLQADPVDVYFVGDSLYDVETALNAKMMPVVVPWGYGSIKKGNASFFHCSSTDDVCRLICSSVDS